MKDEIETYTHCIKETLTFDCTCSKEFIYEKLENIVPSLNLFIVKPKSVSQYEDINFIKNYLQDNKYKEFSISIEDDITTISVKIGNVLIDEFIHINDAIKDVQKQINYDTEQVNKNKDIINELIGYRGC